MKTKYADHNFIRLMDFLKERGETDIGKVMNNPNFREKYKEGYSRGLGSIWKMMYPILINPIFLDNGFADGMMAGIKHTCKDALLFFKENK
jgi:hypothetical protein